MRFSKAFGLALCLVWTVMVMEVLPLAAAGAQSGMPIEGTSTLRLVGYYSIDGRPGVVVSEVHSGRENVLDLEPGEPGGGRILCERIDLVGGLCVLSENKNQFTLRLPVVLDSGVGEACLWFTNCPPGCGLNLLGLLNSRTTLAADGLDELRIPSLISRKAFKTNAAKEFVRVYGQQGITLLPHGERMTLALRTIDKERYLNALPPVPVVPPRTEPDPPSATSTPITRDGRIRAGFIKFMKTPLPQVADIYGELCFKGRKLSPFGGLPARQVSITLLLMTDATSEEAKHMLDVIFLLNDLKVVLVGDSEFKMVEW